MDANEFVNYLAHKGLIKEWEVEQAKKMFNAFSLLSEAVNSTSKLSPEVLKQGFILAMGHRTLEQSGVRVMFQIIEELAVDDGYTDARNKGSREISKLLLELFQDEKGEGAKPSQWLGSI